MSPRWWRRAWTHEGAPAGPAAAPQALARGPRTLAKIAVVARCLAAWVPERIKARVPWGVTKKTDKLPFGVHLTEIKNTPGDLIVQPVEEVLKLRMKG